MDFIAVVEADAAKALAEVKTGLTYLEKEGAIIIPWIEKQVPGSAGAIASFLKVAEADAAELAKLAANGLAGEINTGGDAMQTFVLNLIQSTGLAKNTQGKLQSIDVSGVALIKTILNALVSTALAQVLAKLAPAV